MPESLYGIGYVALLGIGLALARSHRAKYFVFILWLITGIFGYLFWRLGTLS